MMNKDTQEDEGNTKMQVDKTGAAQYVAILQKSVLQLKKLNI